MTASFDERLYNLLPAIYRIRDYTQGEPLRALMGIMERELLAVEADVERLYDNWFIETSEEWVVPYIGDLLAVPPLHTGGVGSFSLRAYVANALGFRRRKGSASVLEEVAQNVTGWPTRAVEMYQRLSTTQHVNHPRAQSPGVASLASASDLELIGTPFEPMTHTADVRHVDNQRGQYNIPNISVFLWRVQSYFVRRARPGSPAQGSWYSTFDPTGADRQLFNRPQTETEPTSLAMEFNVPVPLRRRPLYDELNERRLAMRSDETHAGIYFGDQEVIEVFVGGTKLEPEALMICDLREQRAGAPVDPLVQVLIDPVLGRLASVDGTALANAEVSYAYGSCGDVGAGPYNRRGSLEGLFSDQDDLWWAGVSPEAAASADPRVNEGVYSTLGDAVRAWNDAPERPAAGVIAVLDNGTYGESLVGDQKIVIPPGHQLLIVSGSWLSGSTPRAGDWSAAVVKDLSRFVVANELCPCVAGDVAVVGEEPPDAEDVAVRGRLILNGLVIAGNVSVLPGDLAGLELRHCTVVPTSPGQVIVASDESGGGMNARILVDVDRSISGPLRVPEFSRGLRIKDSIVDAPGGSDAQRIAVAGNGASGYGGPLVIESSTVLGAVKVREVERASDCIFYRRVEAKLLQVGCVRYCYLPIESRVPRRFRCQPDLMLTACATEEGVNGVGGLPDTLRDLIVRRATPEFASVDYGDSTYAQLSERTEQGIRNGAEDGAEMGVFRNLMQPQREANLGTSLDEYVRFGMEPGFFFVS